MWLSLAAAQGSRTAVTAKDNFRTIMTRGQLAAAEERTAEWRSEHSPESVANGGQ